MFCDIAKQLGDDKLERIQALEDELGLTIVERPITFVERELGASKMSGNIVVEAMINVTKWGLRARWNTLTGKLPRKVTDRFTSNKA
jgi:hypothetical protein